MDNDAINFSAQVFKVQTLIDGGYRLTLDLLPPTTDKAIMNLMKCRKPGIYLEFVGIPVKQENIRKNDKIQTRSEWQS